MERPLSQAEIDALLNVISSEDDEPVKVESQAVAAAPDRGKARVVDFAKYTKGRKERLPPWSS